MKKYFKDNNLSTNIALLLQNLDTDRNNTSVLDLSKLKDFNFSDINLSADVTAMEAKLNNKLTAGDFDAFINANNKAVISAMAARARLNQLKLKIYKKYKKTKTQVKLNRKARLKNIKNVFKLKNPAKNPRDGSSSLTGLFLDLGFTGLGVLYSLI